MRYAQSGYLYHYAFAMILGLALLSTVDPMANMMFDGRLLSVLIWLPIAGGFVVLALSDRLAVAKWVSLIVSGLTLAFSVPLYASFKTGTAAMQFVERAPWISTFIRSTTSGWTAFRCR